MLSHFLRHSLLRSLTLSLTLQCDIGLTDDWLTHACQNWGLSLQLDLRCWVCGWQAMTVSRTDKDHVMIIISIVYCQPTKNKISSHLTFYKYLWESGCGCGLWMFNFRSEFATKMPSLHISGKMVNGSRYYRALDSVSIASALSSALNIYQCHIRVHQTLTV